MVADFGIDTSSFPDLDPSFSALTDQRVVAEALTRRLTTPRGALPFYPDYGTDVRGWLNESVTQARLSEWRRAVQRECEKDERVASADASLAYNQQSQTLSISVAGTTADGPFALVLSVTSVTVTLLAPR
jgi:phage baseplate assembly protein W